MPNQEQSPNASPAKDQGGPGKLALTSDNQPDLVAPSDGPGAGAARRNG